MIKPSFPEQVNLGSTSGSDDLILSGKDQIFEPDISHSNSRDDSDSERFNEELDINADQTDISPPNEGSHTQESSSSEAFIEQDQETTLSPTPLQSSQEHTSTSGTNYIPSPTPSDSGNYGNEASEIIPRRTR